jgi:hypothetical protein
MRQTQKFRGIREAFIPLVHDAVQIFLSNTLTKWYRQHVFFNPKFHYQASMMRWGRERVDSRLILSVFLTPHDTKWQVEQVCHPQFLKLCTIIQSNATQVCIILVILDDIQMNYVYLLLVKKTILPYSMQSAYPLIQPLQLVSNYETEFRSSK